MQKPDALRSEGTCKFLDLKSHENADFTSNGLSVYRSLSEAYNIDCVALNSPQRAGEELPNVHRTIERLKTWIRGTHTFVSNKHLNRYLAEFAYRYNRRFKGRRETVFERLITACCQSFPISYEQVVTELN